MTTGDEGGVTMVESSEEAAHTLRWKDVHPADELEHVPCPLCDHEAPEAVTTEWGLGIVCCRSCSALYVSPRLKNPERGYWDDAAAKWRKYAPILRGISPHPRDRNYREHLAMIRRARPSGRFLDVGTHCGFFLRLARGQGWDLEGVDASPSSARIAGEAFGLRVFPGTLAAARFPAGRFDIVSLVDVLEHVTQPRDLLREVSRVLAPGGVVFIKVPHARYNLLKFRLLKQLLRQERFDIFDSREHVVHYTVETLGALLKQAGFARVEFYVPRPIQSGAWWQHFARALLYLAARLEHVLFGRIGAPATDLAVLAWK